MNVAHAKKKKKKVIIIITTIIILSVGLYIATNIFASVDTLCARGNYAMAYSKAEEDKKMEVKVESIAAECCAFSVDNMKDPSSFKLREAYYYEGTYDTGKPKYHLALCISGANSYGATVSNYWLYQWKADDQAWEFHSSVSDFTKEEFSEYDDFSESLEKMKNNSGRTWIKEAMTDGIMLDKSAIKRINDLFEAGKLDTVESIK